MELTEKKCAEISKKANDFIKMYKEQLENYDIRDNFLDIALDSFDNEDDMKLFKCFVIFNNPKRFLNDYKENNHDVIAISKLYQTNSDIVNLFLEVLTAFSSSNGKKIRPTKQNLRNRRQNLIEENRRLRNRVIELENMLKEKNASPVKR